MSDFLPRFCGNEDNVFFVNTEKHFVVIKSAVKNDLQPLFKSVKSLQTSDVFQGSISGSAGPGNPVVRQRDDPRHVAGAAERAGPAARQHDGRPILRDDVTLSASSSTE